MQPLIAPFNHISYQMRNAKVNSWPFSHFFIENVFPDYFYKKFLETLPTDLEYKTGDNNYHGRRFADPNKNHMLEFMKTKEFLKLTLECFRPEYQTRFGGKSASFSRDLRLVRDGQGYEIGPHTDAAWKVISLLFYLPEDYALERLGTSLYIPKDPKFTCAGGPHHEFHYFDAVYTAPFVPNSCLGFWKTNTSFHGVEPITIPCSRNVLLYNVYEAPPAKEPP